MENQYLHQFIYSNIQGAARLRTKEAVEAVAVVPCSWRLWRPKVLPSLVVLLGGILIYLPF